MKFKNYKNDKIIKEAYSNITDNYAIVSGVNENELNEYSYSYYKLQDVETYISKTSTEIKESFIIINSTKDQKDFRRDMIELGTKYNQNSIRIVESAENFLISTNKNYNGYPGYGKIGVVQKLNFDVFNESGKFNPLMISEKTVEDGLNIIFPTEDFFC